MKSAYELAMERLNKEAPTIKLTADQKKRIAALESEYRAKIADREMFLQGQLKKAVEKEDAEAFAQLEKQLVLERRKLQEELETKRAQIRQD